MRPTVVVSVRGTDPAVWLADPTHVYVGRRQRGPGGTWEPGKSWPRSPFANPFKVGVTRETVIRRMLKDGVPLFGDLLCRPEFVRLETVDRSLAVACYRLWLPTQPDLMAELETLRGKTLGCWCSPEACHGDVLAGLLEGSR